MRRELTPVHRMPWWEIAFWCVLPPFIAASVVSVIVALGGSYA